MRYGAVLKSGILAFSIAAGASGATELPPLEDNQRVRYEFLSAAVGDEIRKNCPTISHRMMRVLYRFGELKNYALSLGYTRDDFSRIRKSQEAKAQLTALRDRYLEKHGVKQGDVESYCRLGREEIEKNTLTGWLLRETGVPSHLN